jgi:SAM-dependent methyltransferase
MAGSYEVLEPWYEHLYTVLHRLLRERLAPRVRGGRALDAGCGTGFQAAHLAALGYAVHGVDVSAGLLAVARERGAAALVRATVEALPYADASFDAVACCGSTLSFVDAPARALEEIGRVLRPGGRLLLECEHRWSLDLLWALASSLGGDALRYDVTPVEALRRLRPSREGLTVPYPGYGNLRLFTAGELRAMLGHAGLEVQRTWGIHVATNLIPSTLLHRSRVGRGLGTVYRALCALDEWLRRLPLTHLVANSLVILAIKRPDGTPPAPPHSVSSSANVTASERST